MGHFVDSGLRQALSLVKLQRIVQYDDHSLETRFQRIDSVCQLACNLVRMNLVDNFLDNFVQLVLLDFHFHLKL